MRRLMTLSLAAIALSLSVIAYTNVNGKVSAEDTKAGMPAPEEAKGKDDSQGVNDAMLAEQLASWGRKNQHAGAVAVAGSILSRVPLKEVDMKGEGSKGGGKKPSADDLAAEAKKMAGDDKAQVSAIEAIGKMGLSGRGAEKGALCGEGTCAPTESKDKLGTVVYQVTFKGGELATVGIVGDGTGELDLYIVDENKKIVASDDTKGDIAVCEWTPAKDAKYYILILNRKNKENQFAILTN